VANISQVLGRTGTLTIILLSLVLKIVAIIIMFICTGKINNTQKQVLLYIDLMSGLQANQTNCSVCSKDYYCRESPRGNICAPTCSWKELTDESSGVTDVFVALLLFTGVVVGVIVLILTFIRRKRM